MEREIKFRLFWDGKFIYWGFLDDGDGLTFASPSFGGGLSIKEALERSQQFTGRKDKHGVEIYEGDIAELQNPKGQIQKAILRGIVMFSFASFGVEIKRIDKWIGYSAGVKPPERIWFLNLIGSKILEIIGNIHENPELLEE